MDPATEAKLFVNQCLKDSGVFVINPPADQNPYSGMNHNEVQALQINALRNGSILFLYPSGMPMKYESREDAKLEGENKSWHPNGSIRSIEFHTDQRIDSARYFDDAGRLIAEINNGNGVQIVYHRSKPKIRSICEYQNGLKHGLETSYRNYLEDSKQSETQYKNGQRHGIQRSWMPSGALNREVHYQNGKQHGHSTCWHENGNVQSTMQYSEGMRIGEWKLYYENGVLESEYSDRYKREWYPTGQLLLEQEYAEHGVIARAKSYNQDGEETGEVIDGKGHLITGKDLDSRFPKMQLDIYTGDRIPRSIQLPTLFNGAALGGDRPTLTLMLQITAPDNADISSGLVRLILPPGIETSGLDQFDIPSIQSGYSVKLGNIDLMLPAPQNEWTGTILANAELMIEGRSIRYSTPLFQSAPKKPVKQTQPTRQQNSKARPASIAQLGRENTAPIANGTTLPPFSQASEAKKLGDHIWVLYQDPPKLIVSKDGGGSWTYLRESFDGYAEHFYVIDEQTLLLWITGTTDTPELGLPYQLELTKDAGKTWEAIQTPNMDMLIQVYMQNDLLVLTGINIPDEGLPEGEDIYELPRTTYFSSDFSNFSVQPASFWANIEFIRSKSLAPNGRAQVFFADASFLDSAYMIYWSDSRHFTPKRILAPDAFGDLVWSNNSAVIAVKYKGKLIAYYNRRTGEAEKCQLPYERPSSQKDKDEIDAFDMRAKQVIQANGGIFQ